MIGLQTDREDEKWNTGKLPSQMRGNKRSSHLVILTDQAQREMTSREDQDWVEARVLRDQK